MWSRVLAEWETVFWAVVAAKPATTDAGWNRLADAVRDGGAVIAAEVRATGRAERARAGQVVAVAAALVDQLAPGARRSQSALSVMTDGKRGRGHRAKILLDQATHQAVVESAGRGGWAVSDYVGSLTSTAAVLALADSRAEAEVAQLRECLDVVARAAHRAGQLRSQPVEVAAWGEVTEELERSRTLIDRARATRGADSVELDLRSLLPDVFVVLGWPTPWPEPEPVS